MPETSYYTFWPVGDVLTAQTPSTGSSRYACVDDASTGTVNSPGSPNSDTDYVYNNGAVNTWAEGLHTLSPSSDYLNVSGGSIVQIQVSVTGKKSSSLDSKGRLRVHLNNGSANIYGSEIAPTTSYAAYNVTYTTSPFTNKAWTPAEIASLRVGCDIKNGSSSSYKPRVTDVRVTVTYNYPLPNLGPTFLGVGGSSSSVFESNDSGGVYQLFKHIDFTLLFRLDNRRGFTRPYAGVAYDAVSHAGELGSTTKPTSVYARTFKVRATGDDGSMLPIYTGGNLYATLFLRPYYCEMSDINDSYNRFYYGDECQYTIVPRSEGMVLSSQGMMLAYNKLAFMVRNYNGMRTDVYEYTGAAVRPINTATRTTTPLGSISDGISSEELLEQANRVSDSEYTSIANMRDRLLFSSDPSKFAGPLPLVGSSTVGIRQKTDDYYPNNGIGEFDVTTVNVPARGSLGVLACRVEETGYRWCSYGSLGLYASAEHSLVLSGACLIQNSLSSALAYVELIDVPVSGSVLEMGIVHVLSGTGLTVPTNGLDPTTLNSTVKVVRKGGYFVPGDRVYADMTPVPTDTPSQQYRYLYAFAKHSTLGYVYSPVSAGIGYSVPGSTSQAGANGTARYAGAGYCHFGWPWVRKDYGLKLDKVVGDTAHLRIKIVECHPSYPVRHLYVVYRVGRPMSFCGLHLLNETSGFRDDLIEVAVGSFTSGAEFVYKLEGLPANSTVYVNVLAVHKDPPTVVWNTDHIANISVGSFQLKIKTNSTEYTAVPIVYGDRVSEVSDTRITLRGGAVQYDEASRTSGVCIVVDKALEAKCSLLRPTSNDLMLLRADFEDGTTNGYTLSNASEQIVYDSAEYPAPDWRSAIELKHNLSVPAGFGKGSRWLLAGYRHPGLYRTAARTLPAGRVLYGVDLLVRVNSKYTKKPDIDYRPGLLLPMACTMTCALPHKYCQAENYTASDGRRYDMRGGGIVFYGSSGIVTALNIEDTAYFGEAYSTDRAPSIAEPVSIGRNLFGHVLAVSVTGVSGGMVTITIADHTANTVYRSQWGPLPAQAGIVSFAVKNVYRAYPSGRLVIDSVLPLVCNYIGPSANPEQSTSVNDYKGAACCNSGFEFFIDRIELLHSGVANPLYSVAVEASTMSVLTGMSAVFVKGSLRSSGFVGSTHSLSLPGNVPPSSSGYTLLSDDVQVMDVGDFTVAFEHLSPFTAYYFRQYLHIGTEYRYTDEFVVRTSGWDNLPLFGEQHIARPTPNGVVLSCEIADTRGLPITVRGAVVARSPMVIEPGQTYVESPVDAVVVEEGSFGTGPFTVDVTGLAEGTTYYLRSYMLCSEGHVYGPEVVFRTPYTIYGKADSAVLFVEYGVTDIIARVDSTPVMVEFINKSVVGNVDSTAAIVEMVLCDVFARVDSTALIVEMAGYDSAYPRRNSGEAVVSGEVSVYEASVSTALQGDIAVLCDATVEARHYIEAATFKVASVSVDCLLSQIPSRFFADVQTKGLTVRKKPGKAFTAYADVDVSGLFDRRYSFAVASLSVEGTLSRKELQAPRSFFGEVRIEPIGFITMPKSVTAEVSYSAWFTCSPSNSKSVSFFGLSTTDGEFDYRMRGKYRGRVSVDGTFSTDTLCEIRLDLTDSTPPHGLFVVFDADATAKHEHRWITKTEYVGLLCVITSVHHVVEKAGGTVGVRVFAGLSTTDMRIESFKSIGLSSVSQYGRMSYSSGNSFYKRYSPHAEVLATGSFKYLIAPHRLTGPDVCMSGSFSVE